MSLSKFHHRKGLLRLRFYVNQEEEEEEEEEEGELEHVDLYEQQEQQE